MARLLFAVLLALATSHSFASDRFSLFDLTLGTAASDLPRPPLFTHFACGSDGGPPLRQLADWRDFGRCKPEADRLREVYFEYNDAAEQAARAEQDHAAGWRAGTQFDFYPIIASALFDDMGILRGLRLVTDPRAEQRKDPFLHLRPRNEHYLIRLHLMDALGLDARGCTSEPMRDGESAVMGMFERTTCKWARDGAAIRIESVFVRRVGERDINPETGRPSEGQFESLTRAEFRALR